MRDTGIEPVTSSVSGKRAPAAPIARADDGTRTRDPHLGKVMLYQLSHIRSNSPFGVQVETYPPYMRRRKSKYSYMHHTKVCVITNRIGSCLMPPRKFGLETVPH